MSTAQGDRAQTFGLVVVPGVTVDKWARIWSERLPAVRLEVTPVAAAEAADLIATTADAGLVRLPVDPDAFHAIPLYTEATVVVVPTDHPPTDADQVALADLADTAQVWPADDVLAWPPRSAGPGTVAAQTTAAAVELVAAGVGVLIVPQSLARAYHRRDLTYRALTDAPTSTVALAWRREESTRPELIEHMIGIVRGRTVNSTRGAAGGQPAAPTTRPSPGKGQRQPTPSPRRRKR